MTGPMTHPDTDALAGFRAGLLTGRRAAAIGEHLAGCPGCAAVADELAGLPALLATVPAPAMPDRVAAQLDTALAAEVASRNAAERARGTSPRTSRVLRGPRVRASRARAARARSRRARWWSPRVLAPVAAVAAAAAAGGYVLSGQGAAPQFQGASPPVARSSLHSAGGAASGSAGGRATVAGPRSQRMSPAGVTVVLSPVNFQPGTLMQQLAADLRRPATARDSQPASAAVLACVRRVAGGAPLVRVESAHLQGRPVTVVVTRAGTAERVQLAGPGCSAAAGDVLATRTVP